jgi:hypothetical protein
VSGASARADAGFIMLVAVEQRMRVDVDGGWLWLLWVFGSSVWLGREAGSKREMRERGGTFPPCAGMVK